MINPTPRRALRDTPRPRIHPRKLCLRGARCGAVGIHTTGATNYYDSFHSWAVGIKPPRPNHPRKLHFRGARYRATPPQRGTCYVPVAG